MDDDNKLLVDIHIQQTYNESMIRTQVYIPETLHNKLTRLAEAKGEPMAKVVRDFLEDGIRKAQQTDDSGITTLRRIANLKLKGGPRDLSINLDHYLYGGPKKNQ